MILPQMALVEQRFDPTHIADIPAAVRAELERTGIREKIQGGQTVAITAGASTQAAGTFVRYLQSDSAVTIFERAGFTVLPSTPGGTP